MKAIDRFRIVGLVICVFALSCLVPNGALGQSTDKTQTQSERANPVSTPAAAQPHSYDDPDLTREVQLGVREKEYVGLVWWIPFEFWQVAGAKRGVPADATAQNMKALQDYTIVATFLAKVSALGSFDFLPVEQLRRDIVLHDSAGNEYHAIAEPSQDAKNLAAIIKPLLAAAMGKAGENFDMLFFPGHSKDGAMIADATRKGEFTIILKNNIVGVPESAYQWRTPLTAIAPPKYCPVGKERVHADWDYCPRHGVALNQGTK